MTTLAAPPAYHLLAKPTLERYIVQLLESHSTPEVSVAWQGGEPTMMGLDFFKRSVELVEKHRKPWQRVDYSIQTNGVLIDDRWAAFFKEHRFLVGLSVDGPKDIHDTFRIDKRGLRSFDRVMAGYQYLQAAGVDVNVLCTVHAANQERGLEAYRFFRDDMVVRFIQFIPIVERSTETLLPLANLGWEHEPQGEEARICPGGQSCDRPERRARSLRKVPHRGVRRVGSKRCWRGVRADVRRRVGELARRTPGLCIFSETCGLALALEHNGDLYSCDHYVEPDHLLGNHRGHSPRRTRRL
jgi:uncharacterized protein